MLFGGKFAFNGKFRAGDGISEKKSLQDLLASKTRLCNVALRSSALNGSVSNGRIISPQRINYLIQRIFFNSYNH